MRRKNPLAGSMSPGRLVVREVHLGDNDAVHDVRGRMLLFDAVDTVVLRVQENAEVDRILLVRRLEVRVAGGGPYGSGGYPSNGSPPRHCASIDEDGVVRISAWAVIGNTDKGLVLRSPEGRCFGFTADEDGWISSLGGFLGRVEP